MQARLLTRRCAYCGERTGNLDLFLDGHPACQSCRGYFRDDADPERLARVRAYRAERRGGLNRLVMLSR